MEPGGKSGELAFIIVDKWQGFGLGTKMVDYVLEIAKEMRIEQIFVIMLPDNYRALNLAKKMGFQIEYLSDGTVKGTLNLKEETTLVECPQPKNNPLALETEKKVKSAKEEKKNKPNMSEAEIVQP
jgi:ribosomal protein S18 acetylase RimI-like enzyme